MEAEYFGAGCYYTNSFRKFPNIVDKFSNEGIFTGSDWRTSVSSQHSLFAIQIGTDIGNEFGKIFKNAHRQRVGVRLGKRYSYYFYK